MHRSEIVCHLSHIYSFFFSLWPQKIDILKPVKDATRN